MPDVYAFATDDSYCNSPDIGDTIRSSGYESYNTSAKPEQRPINLAILDDAPEVSSKYFASINKFFSDVERASVARKRFIDLARKWRSETKHMSSIISISTNMNYQQIIGMGRDAIPFIIEDMAKYPDHWFWALEAITGEDSVASGSCGDIGKAAKAWIAWAKEKGYYYAQRGC